MAATPNPQQAAQEAIGQEMASQDKEVATSAPEPVLAESASEPDPVEEAPEEEPVHGLIEPIEGDPVDAQTQAAYAHMRTNAAGGAGFQPG